MLLHTVNRDQVTWSQTIIKEVSPSETNISIEDFKFGIYVLGQDLNDPNISYFDVAVHTV